MQRTVLQIPLPKELKIGAEKAALDAGFSSLQEILRVIMRKLADRKLEVNIEEENVVHLSARAEKRYLKATEDFKKGRNIYTAKSLDEFFKQLEEA